MYGQPSVSRPDILRRADEDFVKQATAAFGSREAASKAWWLQGEKFMNDGNLDFAMRRYNQSWLLNPDNYQPYWGFGRVLGMRNKVDEAIGFLEKAKSLCNDSYQKVALISDLGATYSFKAGTLTSERETEIAHYFELANNYFVESTNLDPAYSGAWLRWAHSLYRQAKYAEAWEKLHTARKLGEKNVENFIKQLEQKMPEPK
jgi:tetratricopeptide (TPR) repeat protein